MSSQVVVFVLNLNLVTDHLLGADASICRSVKCRTL